MGQSRWNAACTYRRLTTLIPRSLPVVDQAPWQDKERVQVFVKEQEQDEFLLRCGGRTQKPSVLVELAKDELGIVNKPLIKCAMAFSLTAVLTCAWLSILGRYQERRASGALGAPSCGHRCCVPNRLQNFEHVRGVNLPHGKITHRGIGIEFQRSRPLPRVLLVFPSYPLVENSFVGIILSGSPGREQVLGMGLPLPRSSRTNMLLLRGSFSHPAGFPPGRAG